MKVLARGELTKKLTVRAHAFSAAAREKIEKAGGTVEVVSAEPAAAKAPEPAATQPSRSSRPSNFFSCSRRSPTPSEVPRSG